LPSPEKLSFSLMSARFIAGRCFFNSPSASAASSGV
jgi:hypothetical protein